MQRSGFAGILRLAACAAALSLVAAGTGPAAGRLTGASDPGSVAAVDAVGMVVDDIDRSVAFFSDVLTFEKVPDVEVTGSDDERLEGVFGIRLRIVRMKLGDEFLDLMDFVAPEGRPIPVDSRSNDRWFQHIAIIVSDMDKAYARLRTHKVRHASSSPQRLPDWNENAGGIEAFYFKDPDGHALEILAFPPDKDTERSLRFYRDGLGLKVAGESENHGIEQERLNNVFGARLRITGLTAGAGPGIEFLDYLAPADGRPAPADRRSKDLIAWQTRVITGKAEATTRRLLAGTFVFVSPGVVALSESRIGFRMGALVRDPDGHRIMLAEK